MTNEEYNLIEFPNGIRLAHKQVSQTKIANIGIMLDMGSRDESEDEQGIAHFLEHMAFKGTKKRNSFHIMNRLESLGGELNAYTTKEKICFYASLLDIHIDKAVELLTDITFNSTFPKKQIEKERTVILEEMYMYRDSPEDAIQDEFDEIIFPDQPLGRNILGTEDIVMGFNSAHFHSFYQKHLNTEKIIISSVGNYPISKIEKIVKKYIDKIPHKNHTPERVKWKNNYSAQNIITLKPNLNQAHFSLGLPSVSIKDTDRIPLFFLINLLGGSSMNARLNHSLREKNGLVYGVEASLTSYTDTGQITINFATEPKNLTKCKKITLKEIEKLKQKQLGSLQLHKAKNQLKGQMALSEENKNAMMLMMAKSLLDLGKIPDIDSIFKKIDAIEANQLQELAIKYLDSENMSSLSFLPE